MKKYLLLIISAFTIIVGSLNVNAELNIVDMSALFDYEQNVLVIGGMIKSDKGYIPAAMRIIGEDGTVWAADETIAKESDPSGNFSFEFPSIKLPYDMPSGTYTVEISSGEIGKIITKTFTYESPDTIFQNIKTFNQYISSKDVNALKAYFAARTDAKRYQSLGENGKEIFFELVLNKSYDLPEAIDTELQKEELEAITKEIYTDYMKITMIAVFSDIGGGITTKQWLDTYGEESGIFKDDTQTDIDETLFNPYIEDIKESVNYTKALIEYRGAQELNDILNAIRKEALLTCIQDKNAVKFKEITDTFPTLFELSGTSFGFLSSDKKMKAYIAAGGKKYSSYSDAVNALISYREEESSSSSSGTKNGGSGQSSSGAMTVIVNQDKEEVNNKNEFVFKDISDEHWAKPAVKYLYDNNIINGRTEYTFAPEELITRAEFITMIVKTFGYTAKEQTQYFADVEGSEWYAPYIAAAYENGILKGTDDAKANPNENLSRQDMAVFIYRAFGLSSNGSESGFRDEDEISEYAKQAVIALKENGLINGRGDGNFAANAKASRAETAQIFYNVLKWR